MCEKLAQDNSVLSKLHHYAWQNTYISLYFSLFYSLFTHILYGSSAWKFNSKSNLNRVFIFLYKFCTNELPKSVCSKFNLVHEVHTPNTYNNLLISRLPISRYGNHSLGGDGASLWNTFFKYFFPNYYLTSFLKLKPFLMERFLQTYENEL